MQWAGGVWVWLGFDHLWVNIVFPKRGPNPRGKCDGQVGLVCKDRWGLNSARLGSFVGKYSFTQNGQIPGTNDMGRRDLSLVRLGSFVDKYSFPPKGSKSQCQMRWAGWGLGLARLGSFVDHCGV